MSDANNRDPAVAENGDKRNRDNDGDGRRETVYVEGRLRNGKYVMSQYRALPRKK